MKTPKDRSALAQTQLQTQLGRRKPLKSNCFVVVLFFVFRKHRKPTLLQPIKLEFKILNVNSCLPAVSCQQRLIIQLRLNLSSRNSAHSSNL